MRLSLSKSKNATSLYVIKDIIEKNKRTTKIVEKLGTYDELLNKLNGEDPIEWAKKYIDELNKKEKEENSTIMVQYSPTKLIGKDKQQSFNGGYLFLQKIYHDLGIHKICKEISNRHKFTFNLDSILSRLLYGRIIFPGSKLSTYNLSTRFLEKPDFDIQHIYRALEVISKETDYIQSELYNNSYKLSKRNSGILYYDCTNYFFEIEQEQGLKQYGYSKEHKPNPIVQMGLFMDGDGIPLAFSITKGNTNEQTHFKAFRTEDT
uniref:IS1634 family transposase n=1 Tax=Serpentinicella alkaliphila TaxID=1734049 RepID=UPI002ECFC4F4